ncbi:hypothetical protein [Cupriavidus numazuensis]|nr:hypothetical protein [Cupriavidus numazuensis]
MTAAHDHDDKRVADESGSADPRLAHTRKFRRYRNDEGVSPELIAAYVAAAGGLNAEKPAENRIPWVMIGTACAAVSAAIFAALTYLSSSTQDKVDRGTAPLNVQIQEMDKRITGKFEVNDKVLEKINTRLDSIDGRLSTIELRLERIDSKLAK